MDLPSDHIMKLCHDMLESSNKRSFSSYINDFYEDILSTGFFNTINSDDVLVTDYDKMRVLLKGEKSFRQFQPQLAYPIACSMSNKGTGFIHTQTVLHKCVVFFPPSEITDTLTMEEEVKLHRATIDTRNKNLFFAERTVLYAKMMIRNIENKKIFVKAKHKVTEEHMRILTETCEVFYEVLVMKLKEELQHSCSSTTVENVMVQLKMFFPFLVVQHFSITMFTTRRFLKKHLAHAGTMLVENVTSALKAIEDPAQHLLEEHRALLILQTVIAEIRFSICLVESKNVGIHDQPNDVGKIQC